MKIIEIKYTKFVTAKADVTDDFFETLDPILDDRNRLVGFGNDLALNTFLKSQSTETNEVLKCDSISVKITPIREL